MAGTSQSLQQSQTLKLSPQQIQFIKLLQLQTAELQSRIDEELQVNPALEEADGEYDYNSNANDSLISEYGGNEELNPEAKKENDFKADTDEFPSYSDEAGLDLKKSKSDLNDDFSATSNDNSDFSSENSQDAFDYDDDGNFNNDFDSIDDTPEISDDYLRDSDYAGLNSASDGYQLEEDRAEKPIRSEESLEENLLEQLNFLALDEDSLKIGRQIIGTLDDDGYLRRPLEAIRDDLAFGQNLFIETEDISRLLKLIQKFDPAGIAATSLQECLLLQLDRLKEHPKEVALARRILVNYFEEFTKKHYDKIKARVNNASEDELRNAIAIILKLNPKPGGGDAASAHGNTVIPDFIVTMKDGKLELSLNSKNAPELRVNPDYQQMLIEYGRTKDKKATKEALPWVKQKVETARWFIDAIKQRQQTLMITMSAILDYQKEFFQNGDDAKLRPMILKDIADMIGMDISTISRVANSKFVQTDFGTFSLKHFFSEGIGTDTGEEVSNKGIKQLIKELIANEDKSNPLSDDRLVAILNDRGFDIARRTVAKYREMMDIPVARLRKGF